MSEIQSRAASPEFRANWERIFGRKDDAAEIPASEETTAQEPAVARKASEASEVAPREAALAFAERQNDSETASWLSATTDKTEK